MADFYKKHMNNESDNSSDYSSSDDDDKEQYNGVLKLEISDSEEDSDWEDDSDWDEPDKKDSMVKGVDKKSGVDKSVEAEINYDRREIAFNETFAPGQFISKKHNRVKNEGKLILSGKNGKLKNVYTTKYTDLDHASHGKSGKHDLIKSIKLQFSKPINFNGPIQIELPTVNALGNERYVDGKEHVTLVVFPQNTKNGDVYEVDMVDRDIQQGVVNFLKKFPGQTPDNLDDPEMVTEMGSTGDVLVRVTPRPSALIYYHNTDVNDKGEKVNEPILKADSVHSNGDGFYKMKREVYDKYSKEAKESMRKHLSFADVTSEDFNIVISPVDFNSNSTDAATKPESMQFKGFTNFNTCHPCINPQSKYKSTSRTHFDVYQNTPINFSGMLTITYKKINSKDIKVKFDGK